MTVEPALQVGISVVPATDTLDRIRELVGAADEAGLDLVGIQDHPYQSHFLDTWSLIPALLAETKRIKECRLHGSGELSSVAASLGRSLLASRRKRYGAPWSTA